MKQDLKHIVYLVSTLGNSGPTRQLLYLIRNLDFSLFRVSLVTLSVEPEGSLSSSFKGLPIEMYCLSERKRKNLLALGFLFRNLLRNIGADVIHSQGLRGDICAAFFGYPTFRIATQRNDPLEDYPPLYGTTRGCLAAIVHIAALRRIDQVVTVSKALSEKDKAYKLKTKFIRNGLPPQGSVAESGNVTLASLDNFFNSGGGKRGFIYAGPLVKRKNPEALIKAFCRSDMTDYLLLILGDGPLLKKCRRLAENAPNIAIPGAVENINLYLAKCACYVSASRSEGLPNSVLEALRAGRPAILSDIPAHRELHSIAQGVVTLFRSGDEACLRQKVKDFQTDVRISDLAVSAVSEHFDEKVMSRLYQELYFDILDIQTASQNTGDTAH
jgi:glycosyltransferase involved in cell wall biosynthesis